MLQHSRRRFLAGFAVLGFGGGFLGRAAMAQSATSVQCEAPISLKTVTSLKPDVAKGGVYTDLVFGKMTAEAKAFGQYAEINLVGTVQSLESGIAVLNKTHKSVLKINYFASQRGGEHSVTMFLEMQALTVGARFDDYSADGRIAVPAFKDLNAASLMNARVDTKSISPSASARIAAPAGQLKAKLPKSNDFSGKVSVDGKVIAEVKFPKIALAKIIEALDKEYTAQAKKMAADPAFTGDLTNAKLPVGCAVAKPSTSGGTGRICYLTTAAVEVVGLSDDCWELRQLRAFRDRFAASGNEAAGLMAEYYTSAPSIVNGINARTDAQQIWLRAYWRCIVPSAIAGSIGLDRLAQYIYVRWTHKLRRLAAA